MSHVLQLLKPSWPKALVFCVITCLLPVPSLWREPLFAYTNRYWTWRYQLHQSLFTDLIAGYASSPDVFLGIVVRDYVRNRIGPPLLLLSWLAACTICASVNHLLHLVDLRGAASPAHNRTP